MPDIRVLAHVSAGLLLGALALAPALAYSDDSAPSVEPAEAPETQVDSATPTGSTQDDDERAGVREELERRDTERSQARQTNCDNARTELARVADRPARLVTRPTEDGTQARMSEEEHAAHLDRMRKIEAENCQ